MAPCNADRYLHYSVSRVVNFFSGCRPNQGLGPLGTLGTQTDNQKCFLFLVFCLFVFVFVFLVPAPWSLGGDAKSSGASPRVLHATAPVAHLPCAEETALAETS